MKSDNAIYSILNYKEISPNTHSIIYPLLRWNESINSKVGKTIVSQSNLKGNSDIIILDSKYHKYWWYDKDLGKEAVINDIDRIKKDVGKLFTTIQQIQVDQFKKKFLN